MIVILNRDVKGTGKAGDIVKVSDGYARNMLIPKGYAKEATEGNVRNLEKQKAIAAEKKAEEAEKKAVMEIIKMGRDCGGTKEFVTKRLCDKYGFDEKEAKGKVDLYWEN